MRNHELLVFEDGHHQVSPIVSYGDTTYAAVTLGEELQKALRMPRGEEDFGTVGKLISAVADLLVSYEVGRTTAWVLANYVLTTWVADCLSGVPVLNLWGPLGSESTLLALLCCLCRRPLRMPAPSLRELANLPVDLCPTLVLRNPTQRALAELIAAAGQAGAGTFHAGQYRIVNCALIVCSDVPISCTALNVSLLTAMTSYHRISSNEAETISARFQPRLLGYRLRRHLQVTRSQFDCREFAPATRLLARNLGSALEGDLESQDRLIDALRSTDEQNKVELSQSQPAAVLEALITLSHEQQPWAKTGDVAGLANAILLARGERADLSAKAVGTILRKKFGFEPVRSGPGYHLKLTKVVQEQVHRLASAHGVLSLVDPTFDCELCRLHSQSK